MTSERHSLIKDIFLAACDLEADERLAYLDSACGADESLRSEVEELLSHDQEPGDSDDANSPPDRIGSYRLLQKVGEGGMGEVWEAEQEGPIRRRVALKLVKWGMDTKEVLARFDSERQALALMNHSNIAKAYEAGATEEGRPFFAMEYVKGVPLTEYCDARRLSTRERLTLFVRVCDGVQHAHQKGVIHRDIKPSNILVTVEDDKPVPKIIDFGVAKAISQRLTERTLFTELGQWIGTPEYMSPEQAELTGLDVDTRTDVYSLGVVLYELLAGTQPFDSTELRTAGFDEMRRLIREEEPPRPSTRVSSLGDVSKTAAERRRTDIRGLARTLRGDLDWIVMKALEKDRTRRYGSPSNLADDVGRYLRNQPVEAGPPSTTYRLRKFVSRHRVGVTAGAALVMLLVAGVIGTSAGLLKAQREAEMARKAEDVLAGVFGTLDPQHPMGRALTTRQVLDFGTERVNTELEGMPKVQARLLATLGQAYLNLGHFDEALPLLERSLSIRERELGGGHPAVASTYSTLGWVQYWLADFRGSRESFERSLGIRELSGLSTDAEVARSLSDLAFLEWRSGHFEVADELFGRALATIRSTDEANGLTAAEVYYQRSLLWINQGRYEEACEILNRALKIRRDALGDDHSAVGWVYHLLALCHRGVGDIETSVSYAQRALEIFERELGHDHWSVAFPVTTLADASRMTGDRDTARQYYERGLAIRRATLPPDHPDQRYSLIPFGEFLMEADEIDEAQVLFEEAVRVTEKTLGPDHPETAMSRVHLSLIDWARGNHQEALTGFDDAMKVYRKHLPPNHPIIPVNLFFQASSAAQLGQSEIAVARLREIFDLNRLSLEMLEHEYIENLRGNPDFETLAAEVRANQPPQS